MKLCGLDPALQHIDNFHTFDKNAQKDIDILGVFGGPFPFSYITLVHILMSM